MAGEEWSGWSKPQTFEGGGQRYKMAVRHRAVSWEHTKPLKRWQRLLYWLSDTLKAWADRGL